VYGLCPGAAPTKKEVGDKRKELKLIKVIIFVVFVIPNAA